MTITIRKVTADDLPDVRNLLTQLGYELSEVEVRRRLEVVAEAPDHSLCVAERHGQVIGLLHLYARPALDKPPEVIVQALVVDDTARRSRVGRTLMEVAEQWAGQRGFTSVALTTDIARSDAHSFYERLGYRVEATSHLMRKNLVSR